MCWRLPIVPGRCQPSIFGTSELNFCVRDGNRWTLTVINTNYSIFPRFREHDPRFYQESFGDPCGNRTHVNGVRGRCLNRLTNGPFGAPSGTRTRDTLIKSQVLYQLS